MGMRKLKSALAVAALMLVVAAVAWYFLQERGPLVHLIELDSQSLASLRNEFNRAADSARLIVLLSPI
ncbi:MAG: hypothetical protein DMG06_24735 [Acidobacteria bacterium]|nr:MAG: hypothetical protein DMG06_24735 [Acidobacteriota bacterium]